jgi:hypothetical protein
MVAGTRLIVTLYYIAWVVPLVFAGQVLSVVRQG